jgi:hypothetical protein
MMVQVDMETSVHIVTGHQGDFMAAPINNLRFIAGL